MANTYVLISSATVGSGGASNITFSNIPQTYSDLVILCAGRSARTGTAQEVIELGINSTYGGIQGIRAFYNGTSTGGSDGTFSYIGACTTNTSGAAIFGNTTFYIPSYSGTTYSKCISATGAGPNNAQEAVVQFAGTRAGTSAITSLSVRPQSGSNWVQYSYAALYGIKNS